MFNQGTVRLCFLVSWEYDRGFSLLRRQQSAGGYNSGDAMLLATADCSVDLQTTIVGLPAAGSLVRMRDRWKCASVIMQG